MNYLRIGGHQIAPASIVSVEGGSRVELQTFLVVALAFATMALCSPNLRIVLGLSVLVIVLVEGHAYLRDRLTVRVRLRDHRTLVLPCLSEREVDLAVERIRSIAPAVEVRCVEPERAAG